MSWKRKGETREAANARRREYMADYRDRHRERGLCLMCSRPVVKGRTQCAKHLEIGKDRMAALRARRHAAGECKECGRPLNDGPFLRCFKCRKGKMEWYKAQKSAGMSYRDPAAQPPEGEPHGAIPEMEVLGP